MGSYILDSETMKSLAVISSLYCSLAAINIASYPRIKHTLIALKLYLYNSHVATYAKVDKKFQGRTNLSMHLQTRIKFFRWTNPDTPP